MKVYFDDKGFLHIDAENNTEMMALKQWGIEAEESDLTPTICNNAHLRTEMTVAVSPVS